MADKDEKPTDVDIYKKIDAKAYAPFSPIIMEFKIPQGYVNLLNEYADKTTSSNKKSKKLDWSDQLVGNTKQEHKIEEHVWKSKPEENAPPLMQWLASVCNVYTKTVLKSHVTKTGAIGESPSFQKLDKSKAEQGFKEFHMHNGWIVNSVAGDFNPWHMHYGIISSAGWLKVPKSIESDVEREKAGWIEFLYGTPQTWVEVKYPVKPEVGKLCIFPAWLHHQVYPFRGDGLRRTISFNASFKF